MTHSPLENPFGFLFASRYSPEDIVDSPQCLKRFAEEPLRSLYSIYCLNGRIKKSLIPNHYATVKFKIIKESRKKDWTIQTTTYEEHYISLAYFSDFMGLSVEDYIDIGGIQPHSMPFKRTNNHPVFDTIELTPSSRGISYRIEVVDICYCGYFKLDSQISHMIGYNDYMLTSPPLMGDISMNVMNVQEFDSNLWT